MSYSNSSSGQVLGVSEDTELILSSRTFRSELDITWPGVNTIPYYSSNFYRMLCNMSSNHSSSSHYQILLLVVFGCSHTLTTRVLKLVQCSGIRGEYDLAHLLSDR